MLNWLRRRLRALERRWIPDPAERSRHQARVRRRLPRPGRPAAPVDEPPAPDAVRSEP